MCNIWKQGGMMKIMSKLMVFPFLIVSIMIFIFGLQSLYYTYMFFSGNLGENGVLGGFMFSCLAGLQFLSSYLVLKVGRLLISFRSDIIERKELEQLG